MYVLVVLWVVDVRCACVWGFSCREMLAEHPPELESNAALTLWLCARHNQVNKRLGKPLFECTTDALEKRWGGCGCTENGSKSGSTAI